MWKTINQINNDMTEISWLKTSRIYKKQIKKQKTKSASIKCRNFVKVYHSHCYQISSVVWCLGTYILYKQKKTF